MPRRVYVAGESTKYLTTITIKGDRELVFTIRSTETVKKLVPEKGAEMTIVTNSMNLAVDGDKKPPLSVMPQSRTWDFWHRVGTAKLDQARVPGGMDPLGYAEMLPPDGVIRQGGTPVEFLITKGPDAGFRGVWNYQANPDFVFLSLKGQFQAEGRQPVNVAYEVKLDAKTGKVLRTESQADSWIQNSGGRVDVQRGMPIHVVSEIAKD